MSKMSLGRISIENFKGIDKLTIDFSKGSFIVLDGPNGFGKTTIFDAIELSLTGQIVRIKKADDGRASYRDVLFVNNSTKDVLIKLEVNLSENNKVIIAKYLSRNKRLRGQDKQPGKWEIFDTYLLESFDDDIKMGTAVEQNKINELLNVVELDRLYSLFYYIQQEENTFFLKKPGKDRMSEISRLFDTKEESDEKEYFTTILKQLTKIRKDKFTKYESIQNRMKKYEVASTQSKLENVEYIQLIKYGDEKYWDTKEIIIESKEKLDLMLEELSSIKDFRNNYYEFEKAVFNNQVRNLVNREELLKSAIYSSEFIESYDEMAKTVSKTNKMRTWLGQLAELDSYIFKIDYDSIGTELDIDVSMLKLRIDALKLQSSSRTAISKMMSDLNQTRNKLLQLYEKMHTEHDIEAHECPFCGHNWVEFENLKSEFELKREHYALLYDKSTQNYETEKRKVVAEFITFIETSIKDYLSLPKHNINIDFFKQVELGVPYKNDINSFKKWCLEQNINLESLVNTKYNEPIVDVTEQLDLLKIDFLGLIKETKEGYSEQEPIFNIFQKIYRETFNSNKEITLALNVDSIDKKKSYLEFIFYSQNELSKLKDKEQLDILNPELQKLDEEIKNTNTIIGIYAEDIKKHWRKIMYDVEIPFYIYSGKIIQNYQKGLGLFIKDEPDNDTGLDKIVFVSDNNSDHDAINYLSSGQLSALVIAFTLSLNKVYGNNDLNLLLIDDPVQSMDEINMASMTELLRNDFLNKQVIISTHEEDVSRYLKYKFLKYGSRAISYNLKDVTHPKQVKQENTENEDFNY